MLWIRFSIGILLFLVGGIWILQGVDLVGGSFMSGEFIWVIIGGLVALAGIALIVTGFRGPRPAPPEPPTAS